MKNRTILLCYLTTFIFFATMAQDYSGLESIALDDKEDCTKNEKLVLECSDYILNSPADVIMNDLNHLNAMQFIMRWMEGTPDYMFTLDEKIVKATKSETALLSVYMAAMCKFELENKAKSEDEDEVKYNSFLIFINYCEDPAMNVKQNKAIKELIKARNENTLKEYLGVSD